MDVAAYLERIGYRGPLDPTAETLRRLHLAHLYSVPFENLSIHWGEPIQLDGEALFEKIVTRRRGGFCYELNGLFATLLRALGFDAAMLSAGVGRANGDYSPDYDHMALLVTLEDRWLADVGFGDSFREPLRLDERGEQMEGDLAYRIEETGDGRLILSRREEQGGPWKPQYRFGLEPHVFADYAEMCHFHQTSPQSHFTQNRLCSLATPDGRLTLSGMKLIATRGGEKQERELDEREYAEALREIFGINSSGSK
ncbi:MAG TPA: arylamine N-acetyltransferase [Thermoanaerobaculia bacterium]|nr:arylamine N-acetyltransferase [Thermoanaerobaculia bacterium]